MYQLNKKDKKKSTQNNAKSNGKPKTEKEEIEEKASSKSAGSQPKYTADASSATIIECPFPISDESEIDSDYNAEIQILEVH